MIYPDGHYRFRVVQVLEDGQEVILDSFHGRTAAQRAEDEEIKRMAKIMYDCDAAGNISAEAAAEALYRAGYRKHT